MERITSAGESDPETAVTEPDGRWPNLREAFKKIRAGDQAALQELLIPINAVAWPIISRVVRQRENQEEVLQDVDFGLYVYIRVTPGVPEPSHFENLIRLIARQRSIDFLRKNRAWWTNTTSIDTEPSVVPVLPDPALIRMLGECLQECPDRQRQALLLWSIGLSYKEIAGAMDVSEAAVRNLINHGMNHLKVCMSRKANNQ